MQDDAGLEARTRDLISRFVEKAVERQFEMRFRRRELLQIWLYISRYKCKHPNLKTSDICLDLAAHGGIEYLSLLPDGALDSRILKDDLTIRKWYRDAKRLIRNDEALAKRIDELMRRNTGIAKAWQLKRRDASMI
jgi:hypothetical protein